MLLQQDENRCIFFFCCVDVLVIRLLMAMQPHDQVTEWHQSSAEARKTKQQKIQQQ
jgi:hypothetical protein